MPLAQIVQAVPGLCRVRALKAGRAAVYPPAAFPEWQVKKKGWPRPSLKIEAGDASYERRSATLTGWCLARAGVETRQARPEAARRMQGAEQELDAGGL